MRQSGVATAECDAVTFSELPMRQSGWGASSGIDSTLSELPMRQSGTPMKARWPA